MNDGIFTELPSFKYISEYVFGDSIEEILYENKELNLVYINCSDRTTRKQGCA